VSDMRESLLSPREHLFSLNHSPWVLMPKTPPPPFPWCLALHSQLLGGRFQQVIRHQLPAVVRHREPVSRQPNLVTMGLRVEDMLLSFTWPRPQVLFFPPLTKHPPQVTLTR
jgi:hypothetical protein